MNEQEVVLNRSPKLLSKLSMELASEIAKRLEYEIIIQELEERIHELEIENSDLKKSPEVKFNANLENPTPDSKV